MEDSFIIPGGSVFVGNYVDNLKKYIVNLKNLLINGIIYEVGIAAVAQW